jgi:ABC-type transporter Mla subunit MlaD
MALQDLTPQLRTRLNRMERAVGWFVFLATALLAFGFGYYIYKTAESKGWFKLKARYFIFTDTAAGLKIADPVYFRGEIAGQILDIQPMPARGPGSEYNVYVEFEVAAPNIGYIWTEGSVVKVAAADFLGKRQLEVVRGTNGYSTYIQWPFEQMTVEEIENSQDLTNLHLGGEIQLGTNIFKAWKTFTPEFFEALSNYNASAESGTNSPITNLWVIQRTHELNSLTAVWSPKEHSYVKLTRQTKPYWLPADEPPPVTDRLQAVASLIEAALPNILALTNQISAVLSNSALLTSNLNAVAENIRPVSTKLAAMSAQMGEGKGSLGDLLIPTNLNQQLVATLLNADVTLTNTDTNVAAVLENIGRSLDNLADLTSNLDAQVQANSNILSQISDIIVHSDQFVQGLKHHWLLRSAFKTPAAKSPAPPSTSPKAKSQNP